MLGKIPAVIGHALRSARAGMERLAFNHAEFATITDSLEVESLAFGDGEAIPVRYTADGEQTSPPLRITAVPAGTESVVLLIEDADSPTPEPLVHAIAW
ncbi:MAG: phosphatidylethanolamine-binding protein, partial [Myxococcaceae bacterium]|nr:phosphatidylethanolamine-binding protein [Myxococcaceae bacterium]